MNTKLLSEIASILLNQQIINKDLFSKNLFWLIGQLLDVNDKINANNFYELGLKKKLFDGIQRFDSKVWLKIFTHFFSDKINKDSKALPLCEKLFATTAADEIVRLLLDQSAQLDNKTALLIVKALGFPYLVKQRFNAIKSLIIYLKSVKDFAKLPVDFKKMLAINSNKIIDSIKELISNSPEHKIEEIEPKALLCEWLQMLSLLNVDLVAAADANSLWPLFVLLISSKEPTENNFKPVFYTLANINSSGPCSNKEKEIFYLKLIDSFLAEGDLRALKCLEHLIRNSKKGELLSDIENRSNQCLELLLKNGNLKEVKSLLELIQNEKIDFSKEWIHEAWKKLFLAVEAKDIAFSTQLLIENQTIFVSANFVLQIQPHIIFIANSLVEKNDQTESAKGIKIALLYNIKDAAFWIKALKTISANAELLIKVISQIDSFAGSSIDCQKCWDYILAKLPKTNGKIFQILLPKSQKILSYYDNLAVKATLAEKLINGFVSLTYDISDNEEQLQELFATICELRDVCRKSSKGLKFLPLELSIIDRQLNCKNIPAYQDAISSLEKLMFLDNCAKDKLVFSLNSALEVFNSLNISKNSKTYVSLQRMVKNCYQNLDLMSVIKFQIESLGDIGILVELVSSEIFSITLSAEKHKIVIRSICEILKKAMVEDAKKFDQLLLLLQKLKALNALEIADWTLAKINFDIENIIKNYDLEIPLPKKLTISILQDSINNGINLNESKNYKTFISNLAKIFFNIFTKSIEWDKNAKSTKENKEKLNPQEALRFLTQFFSEFLKIMDPILIKEFSEHMYNILIHWKSVTDNKNIDPILLNFTNDCLKPLTCIENSYKIIYPLAKPSIRDTVINHLNFVHLQCFISEFNNLLNQHMAVNDYQQSMFFALNYFNLKMLIFLFPSLPENGVNLYNFAKEEIYPGPAIIQFHDHILRSLFNDYVSSFINMPFGVNKFHELSLLTDCKFGDETQYKPFEQLPKGEIANEIISHLSNISHIEKAIKIFSNCKFELAEDPLYFIKSISQLFTSLGCLIDPKTNLFPEVHNNFSHLYKLIGQLLVEISNAFYENKAIDSTKFLGLYALKTIEWYPKICETAQNSIQSKPEISPLSAFTNDCYPQVYSQIVFMLSRPVVDMKLVLDIAMKLLPFVDRNKNYQKSFIKLLQRLCLHPQSVTIITNFLDRKKECANLPLSYDDKCSEFIEKNYHSIESFQMVVKTIQHPEILYFAFISYFQLIIDLLKHEPDICYNNFIQVYEEFNNQFTCLPINLKAKICGAKLETLNNIMPIVANLSDQKKRIAFQRDIVKIIHEDSNRASQIWFIILDWKKILDKLDLKNEINDLINSDLIKIICNSPECIQLMCASHIDLLTKADAMFEPMPALENKLLLTLATLGLGCRFTLSHNELTIPLWMWIGNVLSQEEMFSTKVKHIVFDTIKKYFLLIATKATSEFNNKFFDKRLAFNHLVEMLAKTQCFAGQKFIQQFFDQFRMVIPLIQNEVDVHKFLSNFNDLYKLEFESKCVGKDENEKVDKLEFYGNILHTLLLHMQKIEIKVSVDFYKYKFLNDYIYQSPNRIFGMYKQFTVQLQQNEFTPNVKEFMFSDGEKSLERFKGERASCDNEKDCFIKWFGKELFTVPSGYNYSDLFKANMLMCLTDFFNLILDNYKNSGKEKQMEMHTLLAKLLNQFLAIAKIPPEIFRNLLTKLKQLS